ncbi:MAG: HK97 family phage prohead protease [Parasphingorhabdus sp.]|nr:HK97 family phage prohead protease [Parasphingorhabdus sp.]
MTAIRFAGYAAIFDRIDRGGDIIRPGAFGNLPDGLCLPLLWQHRPDIKIGFVSYAREDQRGLRVVGQLSDNFLHARHVATLLTTRSLTGLSFGYRVQKSSGQNPRELFSLDLAEISLVSVPMQPLATIHAIIKTP